MADDGSWRGKEPWERLRWARMRWQETAGAIPTARAAAESLAMSENTYSAYERRPDSSKSIRLNDQAAIKFGRKFKVRWEWLLTGEGRPWLPDNEPAGPRERVLRALDEAAEDDPDDLERKADAIVTLLRAGGRR